MDKGSSATRIFGFRSRARAKSIFFFSPPLSFDGVWVSLSESPISESILRASASGDFFETEAGNPRRTFSIVVKYGISSDS